MLVELDEFVPMWGFHQRPAWPASARTDVTEEAETLVPSPGAWASLLVWGS